MGSQYDVAKAFIIIKAGSVFNFFRTIGFEPGSTYIDRAGKLLKTRGCLLRNTITNDCRNLFKTIDLNFNLTDKIS